MTYLSIALIYPSMKSTRCDPSEKRLGCNMKVSNLLKIFRLLLDFLVAWLRSPNDLTLENLALRQH